MSQPPSVAVVLVNWNGLRETLTCLESLAQVIYPFVFVIVVDNGSRADEATQIQKDYPATVVLRAGRNLGFSGGNNLGIRQALRQGADYILCLNNDTTVAPDFLGLMVEAMEADQGAGVATCAVFYQSEPDRLNNLGCSIDLSKAQPFDYLLDVTEEQLCAEGGIDIPFAEGCALMMRRAVAEAVGGFDEGMFAYHEDADLCLRAAEHGWRCVAVPRARIWHKINASSARTGSQTSAYYSWRNTWHVVRRHGTPGERRSFAKNSRRIVTANWRWFFRQLLGGERPDVKPLYRDWLIYGTYGIWSGALGLRGSRTRWRVLEWGVTRLIRGGMAVGCFACLLAHPFFAARRQGAASQGPAREEARP